MLCKESLGFLNVKENVRYFEWKVGVKKTFELKVQNGVSNKF